MHPNMENIAEYTQLSAPRSAILTIDLLNILNTSQKFSCGNY